MRSEKTGRETGRTSHGPELEWGERRLTGLFQRAGRRPELPQDELERIEHRVRAEWGQRFGGGARAPRAAGRRLALAAAVLLGTLLGVAGWLLSREDLSGPSGEVVLVVERVTGPVVLSRTVAGQEETGPARAGEEVAVGARLYTLALDEQPTRVALASPSGASIRLDADTRLRIVSARVLELESGAVYVDSPPQSGSDFEIRTPIGAVREVGTQFEVRLLDADGPALRVRVREGRVEVGTASERRQAEEGRELVVGPDGAWRESEIRADAEEWQWVLETAPTFDVDGRTVGELLDWVARETGWRVAYDAPGLEAAVDEIVIRGAFGDLRPDEAHEVVLPAAGLTAVQAGDRLEVARAEDATPRL